MNPDLSALMREAALDAPSPALPSREFRVRVRRRKIWNGILGFALGAGLTGGGFGLAHVVAKRTDVASASCGTWHVTTPRIESRADNGVMLEGGLIHGNDLWVSGFEAVAGSQSVIARREHGSWVRHDIPRFGVETSVGLSNGLGTQIWAAGARSSDGKTEVPVLYEWDGARWHSRAAPKLPSNATITAVTADASRVVVAGSSLKWTTASSGSFFKRLHSSVGVTASTSVDVASGSRPAETVLAFDRPYLFERAVNGSGWRPLPMPSMSSSTRIGRLLIKPDGSVLLEANKGGPHGGGLLFEQTSQGWRALSPGGERPFEYLILGSSDIWASRFTTGTKQETIQLPQPSSTPSGNAVRGMTSLPGHATNQDYRIQMFGLDHFDGRSWTEMKFSPSSYPSVVGGTSNDLWLAVNVRDNPSRQLFGQPIGMSRMLVHWNGKTFDQLGPSLDEGFYNPVGIDSAGRGLIVVSSGRTPSEYHQYVITRC